MTNIKKETDEESYFICPYKVDCYAVDFNEQDLFIGVKFNEKTNFSKANFKEACFDAATFKQVSFWMANFQKETNFKRIQIEGTLKFDNIKLSNESYISFRNINYNEDKKKFIEPHENSKIEITNTVITGRINFINVNIKEIDFNNTVIIGNGVISTDKLNVQKYASWKTVRFLKHEAIKISNTIEALKYKAIEKDEYKKFIKNRRKEIKLEIK